MYYLLNKTQTSPQLTKKGKYRKSHDSNTIVGPG